MPAKEAEGLFQKKLTVKIWTGDYLKLTVIRLKITNVYIRQKGGGFLIRFLFNFKDMKIEMAYPVFKEIRAAGAREYHYYDKSGKIFTWR